MRRVLTSAVLLAVAASIVTASTVTASTAADPGSAVPSAPAAGPPPASEASEPVRYRSGGPASAYVPRTASGKRVIGDAHEVRWNITRGGSSGSWTWQRIGSPGYDAAAVDGLLIDPALAAPAEDPLVAAAGAVLGFEPGNQRGGTGFQLDTDARCEDLRRGAGLVDVSAELIPWDLPMAAGQVRALFNSMMTIRQLPDDERTRVLDTVTGLVNARFGGIATRPQLTAVYIGRKPE